MLKRRKKAILSVGAVAVFILGALSNAFFGEAVKRVWDHLTGRPGPETVVLSAPQRVMIESINAQIELESANNYNPANGATHLWLSSPINPLVKLTPANRGDRAVVSRADSWFSPVGHTNVGFGGGMFEIGLKDHQLSVDGKTVTRVTVLIQRLEAN